MNEKIISLPQARQTESTEHGVNDGSNIHRLSRLPLPGRWLNKFAIRLQHNRRLRFESEDSQQRIPIAISPTGNVIWIKTSENPGD